MVTVFETFFFLGLKNDKNNESTKEYVSFSICLF